MEQKNSRNSSKRVDMKEFELPETLFVHDIDNRVLQGLVLHCLSQIEGISLATSNFIDNILGRSLSDAIRGINAEQDVKKQCVSIRVEVNIAYGLSIPQKAVEIQNKITEDLTNLTGLHVQSVHVDFKNVFGSDQIKKLAEMLSSPEKSASFAKAEKGVEEYSDEF